MLLDLSWVQTVCKSYQQTTIVGKHLQYLNHKSSPSTPVDFEHFQQGDYEMQLVWPRKYAHSSFSSFVQSLLLKDNLLRTYLTSLQLVTGTVWRE